MKKPYSSRHSETDEAFLHTAKDTDIDLSDIPEITADQIAGAILRVGGKPLPKGKVRVNMYLDADLVAFFKAKAGSRGYQTLINEALRESISGEEFEDMLRRVIREELASYSS
ncbi:MAG: BrnA antitoxin family protein [Anaerolineales bacterium]|nr:BrnA antitoxin family protein [Anaerolineales bacterium]